MCMTAEWGQEPGGHSGAGVLLLAEDSQACGVYSRVQVGVGHQLVKA